MRYNTSVQYKRQSGDGAIEINGNELFIPATGIKSYKKN